MTANSSTTGPAVSAAAGRADAVVKAAMSAAVIVVSGVAGWVSYWHCVALVATHGADTVTARLMPATVDGLVLAASLVLLDAARSHRRAPVLARVLLGVGIVATLAANVAAGLAFGPVGAAVAGWPAAALVGTGELALLLIRARGPVARPGPSTAFSAAPVAMSGWLPDVLPPRADIGAVPLPVEPARVTEVYAPNGVPVRSDVARVRSLLADRPGMSGADIARVLGKSARHGRRLRAAALDGRTT